MTINVTKPFLPPIEHFMPYLKQMWDTRVLSNYGPFHTQFENELCDFLGVKHISLFSNGTLALLVAFRALGIEDAEVITTPYSFVATSSTLLWSKNTPVFVDIEADSTNIDPAKIEKSHNKKKQRRFWLFIVMVILAKQKEIEAIARANDLKVIYDAAHAFGIKNRVRKRVRSWRYVYFKFSRHQGI